MALTRLTEETGLNIIIMWLSVTRNGVMIKGRDDRDRITIAKVYRAKQQHIFRWWDELSESEKGHLLEQIRRIDFRFVSEMGSKVRSGSRTPSFSELHPAPVRRLPRTESEWGTAKEKIRLGEELLRRGKVGVVTVAGGQSSRMGLFGSKGLLPLGPITGKTLLQFFAEKIAAIRKRYSSLLPWIIMTSDTTDAQIRSLFEKNQNFGLAKGTIHFIKQPMLPVLDRRGRLIMEGRAKIAFAPNGHGGLFEAIAKDGLLDDLLSNGIEYLFYFQIDNPAVKVADPLFIGMHHSERADLSSKVIWKKEPKERLGVFVLENGKTRVIEYTELPRELAEAEADGGRLFFNAGSIAVHIFTLSFLKELHRKGVRLPYHITKRRVPYQDKSGRRVVPKRENAHKFERFIFDIVRYADRVLLLETDRDEEYCPIKEIDGEMGIEAAQRYMSNLFARWLRNCGVGIPLDEHGNVRGVIEINPLFALDEEELRRKISSVGKFTGSLCLEP